MSGQLYGTPAQHRAEVKAADKFFKEKKMQNESQAVPVGRERTPLESFAQRIETLTDRVREQRGNIVEVLDRIIGNENEKGIAGIDRPESGPGEYNTINYTIDTLCNVVDALTAEVARMQDRL